MAISLRSRPYIPVLSAVLVDAPVKADNAVVHVALIANGDGVCACGWLDFAVQFDHQELFTRAQMKCVLRTEINLFLL